MIEDLRIRGLTVPQQDREKGQLTLELRASQLNQHFWNLQEGNPLEQNVNAHVWKTGTARQRKSLKSLIFIRKALFDGETPSLLKIQKN